MLAGTGSDVGKTVLVAGLCRLARQRGLKVVPFKPQNMSNNAAVAQGLGESSPIGDMGGEIGRGQWLQAFAAGVRSHVDMNPVLLKPQSEAQVVQGQIYAKSSGRDYQQLKPKLLQPVLQSFNRLRQRADLVLVGDIDRGGVIASLVGTHQILPVEDRRMIAGFLINKFRGDVSLFDEGIKAISAHTGWPCFGVVPWDGAFSALPAEDSLALERSRLTGNGHCKIIIPCLSHMANFDELDPLAQESQVELIWLRAGEKFPQDADLIILLGNKSTIAAMRELESNGWAEPIRAHAARGGAIIGICGGLQMLGKSITDPHNIEGVLRQIAGLGLLDMETILQHRKIVRETQAFDRRFDENIQGYEIHLGASQGADCARAPLILNGRPDGAANASGRIWGTYLHGIFANGAWRKKYLASLGAQSNGHEATDIMNKALDEIAALLEQTLDIDALLALAR